MKIILASDQAPTLIGLSAAVQSVDPAATIVTSGAQAASLKTAGSDTDLAILDLDSAGAQWVDAAARLATDDPTLPVAVIASSADEEDILRAIESGVAGYLLKGSGLESLAGSLRLMLAGQLALPQPALHRPGIA